MRISLRQLMLAIGFLSIGLTGLVYASIWWASSLLTVCLIVLTASLLARHYGTADQRPFWSGFAIFGWGYLLLVFAPVADVHIGQRLITTKVLALLQPVLQRTEIPDWEGGFPSSEYALAEPRTQFVVTESDTYRVSPPQWDHFQQVGHVICTLLLSALGGFLARSCHARGAAADQPGGMP